MFKKITKKGETMTRAMKREEYIKSILQILL